MKRTLYAIVLIFLLGCGKSTDTDKSIDSTQIASNTEEEAGLSEEEKKTSQQLDRFMEDFKLASDQYPSISFGYQNEVVSYQVHYYFEDDYLLWVNIERSEEGGIAESYLVHKDPEGTNYLHYGTEIDGAFGYVGMESGEWYKVRTDGNYKPKVVGPGEADKFEYEIEFEETMRMVRENMNKFSLKDGFYTYDVEKAGKKNEYQFSEILFTSNLLSATQFNSDMIKSYLNWWYPLYESANGDQYRHMVCSGGEDYIKITAEAGNYRWEEETSGETIVYLIKGFEESEGDAFYATIEQEGKRLKKTLILTEDEGLMIDGRLYTSNPKRYDYITIKCD